MWTRWQSDSGPSCAGADALGYHSATMTRNFLSIDDLSPADLAALLDLSAKIKAAPARYADRLHRLAVALIF